jgi:hypothetical protein
VPAIYQQSFGAVDPTNSGETSVNSLSRVLSTSSLPAATIDKVRAPRTPPHPPTAHSHSRSPLSSYYHLHTTDTLLSFIFTGATIESRSLTS